jgi:hypothetical protein
MRSAPPRGAYDIEDIAKDPGVDVAELLRDIEYRSRDREEDAEQPDEFAWSNCK